MSNVTDVQLMIGDPATATPPVEDGAIFTADQIQAFLTMTASGGVESIFAGAAAACRSLASSAVLLHKAEKIGNYGLDRKGMSDLYRALAKDYDERDQAIPAVGVMEQSWTPHNAFQIVFNNVLRDL